MRNSLLSLCILPFCCFIMAGCQEKKAEKVLETADSLEFADPDTTLYGVCGTATTMHSIELKTDEGKTLTVLVDVSSDYNGDEEEQKESCVRGGIFSGDRLAIVATMIDGELTAQKVININTLKGKWTSLDRNFEILDDGDVIATVQSEKNPYTSWRIHNGRLLLGRDTFDIVTLGADSLELESRDEIYVYKRQGQM